MLETLIGKIVIEIKNIENKQLYFNCEDGSVLYIAHDQDCCESVSIDDITGDLDDLLNSPILLAEESSNRDESAMHESATWTFYRFATFKGYVTIRWFGESNGYYSEGVSCDWV